MKQYYYATCLAALASNATNGTVGGSSTNPSLTLSNNACSGYQSKCYDYFTYATQAENVLANVNNANSLFAIEIYTIVSNTSLSISSMNTQLNVYATQVLAALNAAAQNPLTRPWAPISCNNTNTGSSDCNYICTNVITPTGFNEDNFNCISTTSSSQAAVSNGSRVLTTGSIILSSSGGVNPDAAIADSNSAVVVPVQSTPDTSSASSLMATLVVIIASAIGLLF